MRRLRRFAGTGAAAATCDCGDAAKARKHRWDRYNAHARAAGRLRRTTTHGLEPP
jgi:hypothetical protein